MIASGTSSSARASRSILSRLRASSGVQWEKFRRATFMPSRMSSRMHSGFSEAGPMVQIILVRRKVCRLTGVGVNIMMFFL